MGMQMKGLDFPSYFEDLREIVMVVEPRLRPIPEMRRHVSRFMDGADMDEVYPGIFLGDCDAASNEHYLLRSGVTHVLNAAGNTCGPAPVKTGPNYYKNPSLTYLGLDLIDLPFINISMHFDKATKYIDDTLASGGKVMVHCRQGRSRSASIVVAFLMMARNMTASAALTLLRKTREVRPNNGFLQQLADLDLNLFRSRLEKLRDESSSESESESESEAEEREQVRSQAKTESESDSESESESDLESDSESKSYVDSESKSYIDSKSYVDDSESRSYLDSDSDSDSEIRRGRALDENSSSDEIDD